MDNFLGVEIKKYPYKDKIKNTEMLYAHIKDNKRSELLEEHMNLCIKYLKDIADDKNLKNVFDKIYNSIFKGLENDKECYKIFLELIYNTVYAHDLGKININFQILKMNNSNFKKSENSNKTESNHSMASAIMYLNYYIEYIKNNNKLNRIAQQKLSYFTFLNGYIISKHHGDLSNFGMFLSDLKKSVDDFSSNRELYESFNEELIGLLTNGKKFFNKVLNLYREDEQEIERYIYSKLLFSLITTCDFYATYEYMNGKPIDFKAKIDNVDKYYNSYKNKPFYSKMKEHEEFLKTGENPVYEENDINRLRAEMNIESEQVLLKNLSKNIFYLEAPTGSGKTITSINLALKILEQVSNIDKLFYVFPFNTLIEQTKDTFLSDVFEDVKDIKNDVSVINSITPIKMPDDLESSLDSGDINYEKALLDRQFLHYPIVLTTNVGFFSYLFGTGREDTFPLMHLINSVIVLDEIQSYKNNIWKEMIMFFNKYADLLNMKIIIMSATLPRLDELVDEKGSCVYLIEDRDKYFLNPLFKDRVKIDYSMLKGVVTEQQLLLKILSVYKSNVSVKGNTNKILVECMKKNTAMDLYKELSKRLNNVFLITGDDKKFERKKIIDKVKKLDDCILVATQVIEAGVDIDMDIGFKDISILDAEEQFLGRINRSCKKTNCIAYFYNLDDINRLYGNDYRVIPSRTLQQEKAREVLVNKSFHIYYKDIIIDINEKKNSLGKGNIKEFKEKINKLDFLEIKKIMTLIDSNLTSTIFLATEIEFEGIKINGKKVWEEYKALLCDKTLSYAEKKVRLSNLNEKVDLFTYQVYEFPDMYDDVIGNLKYIENGEKYMIGGKFDREKYSNDIKSGYSFI